MIKDYSSFFHIDKEHWTEIAEKLVPHIVKKGAYFLRKGEVCNSIGFLEAGAMRTYYLDKNGHDISFLFFLDHQLVADYESVITGRPSLFSIQAVSDTKLLVMTKKDLFELYQSGAYWQEYGRKMADLTFLEARRRIDELLFLSPQERYLSLIRDHPAIFQKIPQKFIASYIGVQPPSLSRIRRRLMRN